jgi:hypothetical protein
MPIFISCDELYPFYSLEDCTCDWRHQGETPIPDETLRHWREVITQFWAAQHEIALRQSPEHERYCRCAELADERCLICHEERY